MDRHVFFAKQSLDPKVLRAAKAIAEDLGVTVLKTGPGTMLVEAEPALVRKLAKALSAVQTLELSDKFCISYWLTWMYMNTKYVYERDQLGHPGALKTI
jgi:hypothetical protein